MTRPRLILDIRPNIDPGYFLGRIVHQSYRIPRSRNISTFINFGEFEGIRFRSRLGPEFWPSGRSAHTPLFPQLDLYGYRRDLDNTVFRIPNEYWKNRLEQAVAAFNAYMRIDPNTGQTDDSDD